MNLDYLCSMEGTEERFEMTVLTEGKYIVTFSNAGRLIKENVCLPILNKSRKKVRCVHPGCTEETTAGTSRCKVHRKAFHSKDWVGLLLPFARPPHHSFYIDLLLSLPERSAPKEMDVFEFYANKGLKAGEMDRVDGFMADLMRNVVGCMPDSTLLQDLGMGRVSPPPGCTLSGPEDLVKLVQDTVERHFPAAKFVGVTVKGRYGNRNLELPIRIVAAILMVAFICEEINRGDLFYAKQYGKTPARGGCMMAFGLYLYIRNTNMPLQLIKKCIRG